jgi:hypothetical protein
VRLREHQATLREPVDQRLDLPHVGDGRRPHAHLDVEPFARMSLSQAAGRRERSV